MEFLMQVYRGEISKIRGPTQFATRDVHFQPTRKCLQALLWTADKKQEIPSPDKTKREKAFHYRHFVDGLNISRLDLAKIISASELSGLKPGVMFMHNVMNVCPEQITKLL